MDLIVEHYSNNFAELYFEQKYVIGKRVTGLRMLEIKWVYDKSYK